MRRRDGDDRTDRTPPAGGRPPPPAKVPSMAVRTYAFLRLGVVAVIAVLAVSVAKQYAAADCLQGSISAYYYLPVRSVFVGALVALGFALIALWGKTPFEDGFMNLAGMLAPVVAFVPTGEARRCGLTDAAGQRCGRGPTGTPSSPPATMRWSTTCSRTCSSPGSCSRRFWSSGSWPASTVGVDCRPPVVLLDPLDGCTRALGVRHVPVLAAPRGLVLRQRAQVVRGPAVPLHHPGHHRHRGRQVARPPEASATRRAGGGR